MNFLEKVLKENLSYFWVLDYILYGPNREGAHLYFSMIGISNVDELIQKLLENEILLESDRSGIYEINFNLKDQIIERLKPFYEDMSKEVSANIVSLMKEDLPIMVRLFSELSFNEDRYYSVFDICDGQYIDRTVFEKWDTLVKNKIAFSYASRTRKHSYHNFEFRRAPFDAFQEYCDTLASSLLNALQPLGDCGFFILYILLLNETCGRKLSKNCKSFLAVEFDKALKELVRLKVLTEKKPREFEVDQGYNKNLSRLLKERIMKTWLDHFKEEKVRILKELVGRYLTYLEFLHFLRIVSRREEMEGEYYIVPREEVHTVIEREDLKSLIDDLRIKGLVFEGFDRSGKDALIFPSFLISETESWVTNLLAQASSFIFVEKGRELKALNTIENLLKSNTEEYVKIWDPYIASRILVIVEAVPMTLKVMILTSQIEDEAIFKRYYEQLTKTRHVKILRIERIPDGAPPFHDRFIVTKNRAWQIGTSLKDVGRKDTTISELRNEQKNIVEKAFDYYWLVKDKVLEDRDLCKREQFER